MSLQNDRGTDYGAYIQIQNELVAAFNINAPINAAEITRILRPGGLYLRVFPGEEHLFDLKRLIYSEPRLHPIDIMPVEGMQHIKPNYCCNWTIEITTQGCLYII